MDLLSLHLISRMDPFPCNGTRWRNCFCLVLIVIIIAWVSSTWKFCRICLTLLFESLPWFSSDEVHNIYIYMIAILDIFCKAVLHVVGSYDTPSSFGSVVSNLWGSWNVSIILNFASQMYSIQGWLLFASTRRRMINFVHDPKPIFALSIQALELVV